VCSFYETDLVAALAVFLPQSSSNIATPSPHSSCSYFIRLFLIF
jgi:hypothetical protein